MNETTVLEGSEDDMLTRDVTDELLENAGAVTATRAMSFSFCTSVYVCPWWSEPSAG